MFLKKNDTLYHEQRRTPRLPLTAPMCCDLTTDENDNTNLAGMVLNVSDEGVGLVVRCVSSIKPGDTVLLWLGQPGLTVKMHVRATIRWLERQEIGLDFIRVSKESGQAYPP